MALDVADARWCRPRRLRGQPPIQLTSVGQRISAWELQTSTQLGVVDSCGGCCKLLGSFVGVICSFPLSSSLPTEFLNIRRCSNCGLGCFLFGSAPFKDCLQAV
jgi:hypothetical protein